MFGRADGEGRTTLDDLLEPEPAEAEASDVELPGVDGGGVPPAFRVRLHGYDRLQVDDYVARSQWELLSARRHAEHLLDRFGACSAELEIARRSLARPPELRQAGPVSARLGEILRLAADEADRMIDAAGEEADRLLAEARLEADARLCKARAIAETAAAGGEDLREQARRERAEAGALLDRAREERDHLVAEATAAEERTQAAVARLAAVQEELADLQRQRDEARSSLRRLTDQIGQVLHAVDPADLVGAG